MFDLTGQAALVTGGAQGIGLAIARELSRAGCRVIVADKNLQKAEVAAEEIGAEGRQVLALPLDVTDAQAVRHCVQGSIERFSRIDILINNAAVLTERFNVPTTEEHFNENFDVNVLGVWHMSQALVPHFKANGGGKIVNIASIAGLLPYAQTPAYSASKAAVINLTRSLAMKLGEHNINVNAVCPGAIPTEMTLTYRNDMPHITELEKASLSACPLKQPLLPEDIGCAVVFFASSAARSITGQSLNVDLGFLMS